MESFQGGILSFFLDYLDIDSTEFWKIIDKFRSPHVWIKEKKFWKLTKAVYDNIELPGNPGYLSNLPESYYKYMETKE